MTRVELMEALAAVRGNIPAISGPGLLSRLLWSQAHNPASIYQMDMGYAAAMCVGLALATPDQKVIAVEGDGAMIAGLTVFTTIGRYKPQNLIVVVGDNGVFASAGTGAIETGSAHGTDIAAVAVACGIPAELVLKVDSKEAAAAAFRRAVEEPGPWVIVGRCDRSDLDFQRNRKSMIIYDIVETAINFRREMIDRGYTSG